MASLLGGDALTNMAIGAVGQMDNNWNSQQNEEFALMKQRQALVDKVAAEQDLMAKQAEDVARSQNSYVQTYGIDPDMAYALATNPNVKGMKADELGEYIKSLKPTGQSTDYQPARPGQPIAPGYAQNRGVVGSLLGGPGVNVPPVQGVYHPEQPARKIYQPDSSYVSQAQRISMVRDAFTQAQGDATLAGQILDTMHPGASSWIPAGARNMPNRTQQNEQFNQRQKLFDETQKYVAQGGKDPVGFMRNRGAPPDVLADAQKMDFNVWAPENAPERKVAREKEDAYYQGITNAFKDEPEAARHYLARLFAQGVIVRQQDAPDSKPYMFNVITQQKVDAGVEKQLMDEFTKAQPNQQHGANNPGGNSLFNAFKAQEGGPSTNVMQIQPDTWKQYAKAGEDIANPQDNAAVGQRILDDLSQKFNGDPARIAVGYFSGPGNVAPADSPTPWLKDLKDANGKTVSSYVSDIQKKLGSANNTQLAANTASPIMTDATQQTSPAAKKGFDEYFSIGPQMGQPRSFYENRYNSVAEAPKIDQNIRDVIDLVNKDPAAVGAIGEIVQRIGAPGVNVAQLMDQYLGTNNIAGSVSNAFNIGDRKALEVALTNLQTSLMRPTASAYQPNNAAGMGTGGAEIQEMWHQIFENGDFHATAEGLKAGLGQILRVNNNNFLTDLKRIGKIPEIDSPKDQAEAYYALRQAGFNKAGAYEMLAKMHQDKYGQ